MPMPSCGLSLSLLIIGDYLYCESLNKKKNRLYSIIVVTVT